MKNITILIPIHKVNEFIITKTQDAIESVRKQRGVEDVDKTKILIVIPKDLYPQIKDAEFTIPVQYIINDTDKTDFATQLNIGIKEIKTEWFSVLEYDDIYTETYFKNFNLYKEDLPAVGIFLPITVITDFKENKFIAFENDKFWSNGISKDKIGFVEIPYFDFYNAIQGSGAIFKTELFEEYGYFKVSVSVAFWCEFFMRVVNKGVETFSIPKIGYIHYANRDDSGFFEVKAKLSDKEIEAYFELAKREYVFKNDRNKEIVVKDNDNKVNIMNLR